MKPSLKKILIYSAFIAIGLGFAAAGFYVGETDDSPGAAGLGVLLMIGSIALGHRIGKR